MYTKSYKKFQHEDLALTVSALINCCENENVYYYIILIINVFLYFRSFIENGDTYN